MRLSCIFALAAPLLLAPSCCWAAEQDTAASASASSSPAAAAPPPLPVEAASPPPATALAASAAEALQPSGAEHQPVGDKVMGGRAAGWGEYPGIAEMSGMASGNRLVHVCAGVLIAPSWILSAAHCNNILPPGANFYVTINRPDVTSTTWTGEQLTINRVVVHPDWGKGKNDIALYHLSAPSRYAPMPRAMSADIPYAGQTVDVAGWGITSSNSTASVVGHRRRLLRANDTSRRLQWWWNWNWWDKPVDGASTTLMITQLQVMDHGQCNSFWNGQLMTGEICASDPSNRAAVCAGDSGGPMLANGQVVGILSFGKGDRCSTGGPAVFTRVGAFADWITANLASG